MPLSRGVNTLSNRVRLNIFHIFFTLSLSRLLLFDRCDIDHLHRMIDNVVGKNKMPKIDIKICHRRHDSALTF